MYKRHNTRKRHMFAVTQSVKRPNNIIFKQKHNYYSIIDQIKLRKPVLKIISQVNL